MAKTTKTIVFAALIAAMILTFSGMQSVYAIPGEHNLPEGDVPDGLSGEHLTIGQLQEMIWTSERLIAHYQDLLSSSVPLRDHRNESIIAHQAILDGLDAIVNSGGVLTADQIEFYDDTVDEIINLERANRITGIKISNYYLGIDRHQAVIDWAQAELGSR